MSPVRDPKLPTAVGPLSATVLELIVARPPRRQLIRVDAPVANSDPYGLDLQLALHVCYELHYRGFAGVDPRWEWDPGLLHLRATLEAAFGDALRQDVGEAAKGDSTHDVMAELSVEPADGEGLSYFLRDEGTWEQMCEYFVHRSIYHLKEGDPHAWLIPRLTGQAKARHSSRSNSTSTARAAGSGPISSSSQTYLTRPGWTRAIWHIWTMYRQSHWQWST